MVSKFVDTAVAVRGLTRKFGAKNAVNGIDITIPNGQIYGFLGPNGAGKSTTVRILTTLTAPTGGEAFVAGFDVAKKAADVRVNIGAALQEASLDPKQTGRELIYLQGQLYGLPGKVIKKRIAELEKLINIGDAFDKRIATYSGGMKRRLDLAAAIIHIPSVLFLDEPTTGLDPRSRHDVWEQIRTINKEYDMTVFLTTQYMEEADAIADRLGIIVDGKIVAEGTPDELKARIGRDVIVVKADNIPKNADTEISKIEGIEGVDVHKNGLTVSTTKGATHVSDLAITLNKLGVKVEELTLRSPTLDDVFLKLTGTYIGEATDETKKDDEN